MSLICRIQVWQNSLIILVVMNVFNINQIKYVVIQLLARIAIKFLYKVDLIHNLLKPQTY